MTFIGHSEPVKPGMSAMPIWCDVCGTKVFILLPGDIGALAALGRAFEDLHAECVLDAREREKSLAPTPQGVPEK